MTASILVVDDESTTQDTLGLFLETEGYSVAVAGSGEEALTRIEQQEFDVIVADVVMPGVSGLEVLERSRALNPSAAVILMTGHATVDSAAQCGDELLAGGVVVENVSGEGDRFFCGFDGCEHGGLVFGRVI